MLNIYDSGISNPDFTRYQWRLVSSLLAVSGMWSSATLGAKVPLISTRTAATSGGSIIETSIVTAKPLNKHMGSYPNFYMKLEVLLLWKPP